MTTPLFVSVRGRAYTSAQVRPIVLARLRRRWGDLLKPGWIDRVDKFLRDPAWLRQHNGEIPAALAHDLDAVALSVGREMNDLDAGPVRAAMRPVVLQSKG